MSKQALFSKEFAWSTVLPLQYGQWANGHSPLQGGYHSPAIPEWLKIVAQRLEITFAI